MADKEQASDITISIKSTKEKMEIKVSPSMNVSELKKIVKERLGNDVKGELCLIFSGKILKDDDTLQSHGVVKDGLTLHLVFRGTKTTSSTGTSSASSTSSSREPSSSTGTTTSGGSGPAGTSSTPNQFNPFGMMGGLPPQGDMQAQMQQLFSNPEIMQQLIESPMMQSLMSNPDAMQSLFTSNPQIQQLMERNPELSHILNNPDLMRQALEMARNPGAMREMMRSQDRQLSNIESLPGGFNALARMYSEIQEPMMDAAQESIQQQVQNNPFAALFSSNQQNPPQAGPSAPQGTANTNPLPNPWGGGNNQSSRSSGSSSNQSGSNSTQRPNSTGTTTGTGGSGGGLNLADMMRVMAENPNLMSQMGAGPYQNSNPMEMLQDPNNRRMYQQMMQNPESRQAMIDLMSNPQALQSMIQLVPGMQNMLAGQDLAQLSAQTAQMMNNPQMLEMLSNPEAMQGYMNMMQGYNQMMQATNSSNTGGSGTSTGGSGTSTGGSGTSTGGSGTSTGGSGTSTGGSGTNTGGSTGGTGTGSGGSGTPPNNAALLQMMQQMMGQGGVGGNQTGGVTGGAQSTGTSGQPETQEQAAARRYRVQLETLERMGFPDRNANVQALINSGGDLNAAIDKLIKY